MKRILPPIGSPGYHVMLAGVAIFILGPLGGISAAFMNFSIGFFIGGQVLAGILGSTVTLPYGPEGKHGANYMQTMAASVAGMCGMAVLVQAMSWLGLPEPATWKLVLYFMCIGMFGVGLGMLYTPILVDKMQLAFPSGFAVANILRALTDKNLLKRSIAKLGGGMLGGYLGGLASLKIA
ncbi:MAG TPA: OPT/YSL family transporter, partial [Opitutaceae bacterium]|nr:OPT/YSL family transporter [Opitutaceae bacterium]